MLFASFPYLLLFLPLVVLICIALQKLAGPKAAQLWILAASLFFYAKSTPFNLVYLLSSILANWLFARAIDRAEGPARKRRMILGVTLNVAYLCVFKYLGFFGLSLPHLPFPLGISFFTIMQIMYLVDCYEGTLSAGTLFDHATFVSFFPYVISGTIARAKRMRHQFGNFGGAEGKVAANVSRGLFHFSMGVFKKAVFADSFARVAAYGNNVTPYMSLPEAWIYAVAYALQLYFDFSGYSDMAIGSAMMLGIDLPRNFDAPYSATSIVEFWQRWHISLTQFITSYLYTPIFRWMRRNASLNRNMLLTSSMATLLAMGIAGLWHGAAWTFVIFGLLHGAYLGINQYWRKKKFPAIPAFPSWLLTFTCVLIALTYFGAASVPQATHQVKTMFNPWAGFGHDNLGEMVVEGISLRIFGAPLLVGLFVAFFGASSEQRARDFHPTTVNCVYAVAMLAVALVFVNSAIPTPFVYFRF